ncbi:MAG TPA: response regulator [candidate division Zixibacteria bacterium]|nr:response regulator [candidate division Zixibacteria bacterium]
MKRRILIIDDELHMLKLLERTFLEKTSYQVITTNNSLEITKMLEQERYDLIITDLKMPGCDGMDILRWIKAHDRSEEVIIITAFGSSDTADEALRLGAFDYITKPFRREEILMAVERALSLRDCKIEVSRVEELFKTTPFEKAVARFQNLYLHKMTTVYGHDVETIAVKAGLPSDIVRTALEERHDED